MKSRMRVCWEASFPITGVSQGQRIGWDFLWPTVVPKCTSSFLLFKLLLFTQQGKIKYCTWDQHWHQSKTWMIQSLPIRRAKQNHPCLFLEPILPFFWISRHHLLFWVLLCSPDWCDFQALSLPRLGQGITMICCTLPHVLTFQLTPSLLQPHLGAKLRQLHFVWKRVCRM